MVIIFFQDLYNWLNCMDSKFQVDMACRYRKRDFFHMHEDTLEIMEMRERYKKVVILSKSILFKNLNPSLNRHKIKSYNYRIDFTILEAQNTIITFSSFASHKLFCSSFERFNLFYRNPSHSSV